MCGIAMGSPNQDHDLAFEQAQCLEPLLAISLACVFLGQRWTVKDRSAKRKVDLMYAQVIASFLFSPCDHPLIVHTETQKIKVLRYPGWVRALSAAAI
jgi:hypothetical protein